MKAFLFYSVSVSLGHRRLLQETSGKTWQFGGCKRRIGIDI